MVADLDRTRETSSVEVRGLFDMKMSHYRAAAYALLAISFINAIYQQADSTVVVRALLCAALAGVLLLLSARPAWSAWLAKPAGVAAFWTVIALGLLANLVG